MGASEWTPSRLGDIVEIEHGWPFKSQHFHEDLTGQPIVVSVGNFRYAGGFRFAETSVKEYRDTYPKQYELLPGDMLLIMTCQTAGGEILGVPARVPNDGRMYLHNQRLGKVVIRDGASVVPEFLYWLFLWQAFNRELVTSASGTKILHTAPSRIEAFRFNLPPKDEQRAISHILGTLDDKIELNRRMNETLEAMARALFKSWFVDFDPVRAKAEGRDPGLPKPLADLFPAHLVDSELGEIPAGWKVAKLAELSVLNPEVWTKQTRPREINYVELSNTKWGRIEAVTAYAANEAPSRAQRVLWPGDTIVGTVRPGNGSYALISERGLTGSTGFAVLRPSTPQYAQFVYLAATVPENMDALAHLADGGAYPAVRPEVVAALPVVRADDEVLGRFSLASGPLLTKMAHNEREARKLADLRDALLPRLISGQVRVGARNNDECERVQA
jgi:type I restriction enzyme S subunit